MNEADNKTNKDCRPYFCGNSAFAHPDRGNRFNHTAFHHKKGIQIPYKSNTS